MNVHKQQGYQWYLQPLFVFLCSSKSGFKIFSLWSLEENSGISMNHSIRRERFYSPTILLSSVILSCLSGLYIKVINVNTDTVKWLFHMLLTKPFLLVLLVFYFLKSSEKIKKTWTSHRMLLPGKKQYLIPIYIN